MRQAQRLQRAHDDLSAAIDQLQGLRRQRTLDLLSDLDQAMQRRTAKFGNPLAPGEESLGLLVPSRELLNGLATEALELQRNVPAPRRLPNTIVVDVSQSPQRERTAEARAREPIEPADQELLSWPLGFEAGWP